MKKMKNPKEGLAGILITAGLLAASCTSDQSSSAVVIVNRPDCAQTNVNCVENRLPLKPMDSIKLPVGSTQPEGWLKKYLGPRKDGLTGHLNEISVWLDKESNARLTQGGDHGWEEVPYWLKGYGNLAYTLKDQKMIDGAKMWLEGAFASQQSDGYFGPINK